MPSTHNPKCMFRLSSSNSACFPLTCAHVGESYGPCILLSFEIFPACHDIKEASCGVENIRLSLGINGKCLNTLLGTVDIPTLLYLQALHTGHVSVSAYSFLNNMHPFLHACIASYFNPSRLNILVAIPSLVGKEFGVGKITLENKCNNSLIHSFVTLCVRQTFKNIRVVSSRVRCDPQKRGVLDSSFRATSPSNPVRPVSWCLPGLRLVCAGSSASLSAVSPPLSVSVVLPSSPSASHPSK